jgi:Fe-S cluster biogenesis protein NfuA
MPPTDDRHAATLRSRVEQAIERLRPALNADGGDVEIVEVSGSVVTIKMVGACCGCPMSMMTLKAGIEAAVVEAIPEITAVEAV